MRFRGGGVGHKSTRKYTKELEKVAVAFNPYADENTISNQSATDYKTPCDPPEVDMQVSSDGDGNDDMESDDGLTDKSESDVEVQELLDRDALESDTDEEEEEYVDNGEMWVDE